MTRYLSLSGGRKSITTTEPEILWFVVDTLPGDTIYIYAGVSSDVPVDSIWVMLVMDDTSYIDFPDDSTSPIIIRYPIVSIPESDEYPFEYEAFLPDTYSAGIINYVFYAEDSTGDFAEIVMTDSTASIDSRKLIPESIRMTVNPNPFNSSLSISYFVPEKSGVSLEIYDVLGARLATIVSEQQSAGTHTAIWTAPKNVHSGVYFVRFKAGERTITKRALLIK